MSLCLYAQDEYWLDYGLFSFHSSNCDDTSIKVSCVFSGGGPGNINNPELGLREFRHTYFGEKGYCFYLPIEATIQALKILNQFFD